MANAFQLEKEVCILANPIQSIFGLVPYRVYVVVLKKWINKKKKS